MEPKRHKFLTVPNLLSVIRLLMIPLMIWLFLHGNRMHTAVVLISSGLTDLLDGFIARKFNQISDIGKALDPIADKLTQAAMLFCLTKQHLGMLLPFLLLAVKEICAGISGLIVIRRTGVVPGAQWHGKLATLMLYGMMIVHVSWQDIPMWTSNVMNGGCIIVMLLSMTLYARQNIRLIRNASHCIR